MKELLAVGAGSFLGGILRYLIQTTMNAKYSSAFPYGTLIVNIAGCFFIGFIYGLADRENINPGWKLFLAGGVLGGFTTFSAFSGEVLILMREGNILYATVYILSSVVLGILASLLGFAGSRLFAS